MARSKPKYNFANWKNKKKNKENNHGKATSSTNLAEKQTNKQRRGKSNQREKGTIWTIPNECSPRLLLQKVTEKT